VHFSNPRSRDVHKRWFEKVGGGGGEQERRDAEKTITRLPSSSTPGLGRSIMSGPRTGGRSIKQTLQFSLYSTVRSAGNASTKVDSPIDGRPQGTADPGVFGAFSTVSEADDLVIILKQLSAAASETSNTT